MLYTLVKYIDSKRFDITIVALRECKTEEKKNFSELLCNVIILKKGNLKHRISQTQEIIDFVQPDVVHSHGGMADLVNIQLKGSHKSFSTIHCDPDEDFSIKKGKIAGWLQATVFLRTLKRINFPIACSKTVATNIEKKRHFKFHYVRNGIDIEKMSCATKAYEREEYGIEKGDTVLVFCGYLSKRKNLRFVLKVFQETQRNDIKLIVIGDGTEYDTLRENAKNDKRISFLGRVDNSYAYLNMADYFISASLSEGLPLAVMEGMLCGLPAILSNIDSHTEISDCCQRGVQLFSLTNSDELRKIIESIAKPSKECIDSVKSTVEEYFNASRMAAEYQILYFK